MTAIVKLMKKLGYHIEGRNIDAAFILMAEKSRNSGEYGKFKARMDYLNGVEKNKLKDLLNQAKAHQEILISNKTNIPLTPEEEILVTVEDFFFKIFQPNSKNHFDVIMQIVRRTNLLLNPKRKASFSEDLDAFVEKMNNMNGIKLQGKKKA